MSEALEEHDDAETAALSEVPASNASREEAESARAESFTDPTAVGEAFRNDAACNGRLEVSAAVPVDASAADRGVEPHDDIPDDESILLDALPPLPAPRYRTRRSESVGGITLVSMLTLVMLGATFGGTLVLLGGYNAVGDLSTNRRRLWYAAAVMMTTWSVLAVTSLVCVLNTDPGVVPRNARNCLPLPVPVSEWLEQDLAYRQTGGDVEQNRLQPSRPVQAYFTVQDAYPSKANDDTLPMSSNDTPTDKAPPNGPTETYCTKCMVWRRNPQNVRYYHCPICQRCVAHFDHHCGVLGRCIAGRTYIGRDRQDNNRFKVDFSGNYKYFAMLLVCGVLSWITFAVTLILALSLRYAVRWVLPVSAVVLFWIFQAAATRNVSPTRSCRPLQRLVMSVSNCFVRRHRSRNPGHQQHTVPPVNTAGITQHTAPT